MANKIASSTKTQARPARFCRNRAGNILSHTFNMSARSIPEPQAEGNGEKLGSEIECRVQGQPNNFFVLINLAIGAGTCFSHAGSPFFNFSITLLDPTARYSGLNLWIGSRKPFANRW